MYAIMSSPNHDASVWLMKLIWPLFALPVKYSYLLLAEFSFRTVNYGTSFFPSIYGPSAKPAGHKSMEKNEENGILNIESYSRKLSGWKQYPRTMAGMFHINILTYELNKQSCR